MPSFLNLMDIELRVIRAELGVSLLFVLAPDIQQTIRPFNGDHFTNPFF